MFKIRGAIVVYFAGIRLFDVAGSSFGAPHLSTFLKNVVEGISELIAEPKQEYRLVPAENRQFQLPE